MDTNGLHYRYALRADALVFEFEGQDLYL